MAEQIPQNPPSYNVFTFVFSLGQIVGAFPLRFIEGVESCAFKFQWMYYKTFYSIIHIVLLMITTFFCVYSAQMAEVSWTFRHIVRTLFYSSSLLGSLSLFFVSKKCPNLLEKWIVLDNRMECNYGFPKNMYKRAKLTALVTFIYAFGQILIFILYNAENVRNLARAKDVPFEHSIFFKTAFAQVFTLLPYSIVLGITCQFIYFFSIWRMAYSDLFISLISSFLSNRFQQITERLSLAAKKRRTIVFWREVREDYDRLCVLCKEVDDVITNIVFVSYTTNLVLLLVYLRNCTIVEGMTLEKLYNIVCFIVYLIRIFIVSLYVSWINDASKEPSSILNSVSTAQYNTEIQRFLQQISSNTVVFTGCKMFKVTRTLILNIGGIILTYELVLVQFSELNFT